MRFLFFITAVLNIVSFTAQAKKAMPKKTVDLFVNAINAHNVKDIASLMSDDHVFIDAAANKVEGKEKMMTGWEGYFKWFPDYKIEITNAFVDGDTVAAFGFASGSYEGNKDNHWHIPASWRAIVSNGKISMWQVYADTKIPFDIIEKNTAAHRNTQPRATGIGGIFFKCKDPGEVKNWYKQHLHLNTDKWGTNFVWRQGDDPTKSGSTQWSPFSEKTTYFAPSTKEFMINYRVENLEALIEQFKKDGVTIVDKMETVDYGKFIHILDCEGNKVELWEPVDAEYDKLIDGRTK